MLSCDLKITAEALGTGKPAGPINHVTSAGVLRVRFPPLPPLRLYHTGKLSENTELETVHFGAILVRLFGPCCDTMQL